MMQKRHFLWLVMLLAFACNTSPANHTASSASSSSTAEDTTLQNDEEAQRLATFGFDTLPIRSYQSDNGHLILLEGSKSQDTYRISVTSKQGQKRQFQIAEEWYVAAHSSIAWDSDDFMFVHFGCGTACWGGTLYALNTEQAPITYMEYAYADSVRQIVGYPNPEQKGYFTITNLATQKSHSVKLNYCSSALSMSMAITDAFVRNNELVLLYQAPNCADTVEMPIDITPITP